MIWIIVAAVLIFNFFILFKLIIKYMYELGKEKGYEKGYQTGWLKCYEDINKMDSNERNNDDII